MIATKLLQDLIGLIEGVRLNHHTSHWNAMGPSFYSDHKMFQEFYEGGVDEMDAIAEHAVRLGATIDPCEIVATAGEWLAKWKKEPCPFTRAMKAEETLATATKAVVSRAKDDIGLDNTLRGIADKHTKAAYFLGQTLKKGC